MYKMKQENIKLKLKNFKNFIEPKRTFEYEGQNFQISLTYIDNVIANKIDYTNVDDLINCLNLKPFKMIIVIEQCIGGYSYYVTYDKDWFCR